MTKIEKIKEKELFTGLKNGSIEINDFTIEDDEVIIDFYSETLDEELDDVTKSIAIDKVIEKLEFHFDDVVVSDNNFYLTSNHTNWVDCYDNSEEDHDKEKIEHSQVIDALYEILIEQKPKITYQIEVSTEVQINLNDFDISATQWQKMSDADKKKLVIREFNETRGILAQEIKQAV